MARELVVVESPAKARTISRILGGRYLVKACLGHVRDLPPDEFGVDVTNGFTPRYIVIPEKRRVLKEIRESARKAEAVYLATDPDREGEAIAWHLVQAASLDSGRVRRVTFHEITPQAVRQAFRQPRGLDLRLVNAQQARRILDRLVGYRLSPLLWEKLRWSGLSAGRVQSAALRMVVEREREIQAFVPREYWTVEALLSPRDGGQAFTALLHSRLGERARLEVRSRQEAQALVEDLRGASYTVAGVRTRQVRHRPPPPFITSTLQQEAWRKLRFPAKKTMQIAQQLYEGVPLGDEGSVGLITYMRTDSPHVAESAVAEARRFIGDRFGRDYLPPRPRAYTARARTAQEAHEAIRPTSVAREPDSVKPFLTPDQARLYELVWRRFLASQMADALSEQTTVEVHATKTPSGKGYLLRATGSVPRFPGFRAVYQEGRDEPGDEEGQTPLPPLQEGMPLACQGVTPRQHFTQPPPRYSEATLIRALEERGIGRPSTYAAIVSTIQERGYVRKEEGRLRPTPLGTVVNDLLTRYFPDVVDLDFTARLEEELDEIASGEREWVPVLKEFYTPFSQALKEAEEAIGRVEVPTEERCDACGKPMVLKRGRFGPFLSCSDFPRCRNARPLQERTGATCPRCGGDLVQRRARRGKGRGKAFYGCANYPTCNFTTARRPLPRPCPQCGGLLVAWARNRARCTACDYQGPQAPPEEA